MFPILMLLKQLQRFITVAQLDCAVNVAAT